jgi:predicted Zn-dependent protease
MAARGLVAAVAVLLIAWLGAMERGAQLEARGNETLRSGDLAGAESDLRRAASLTPDTAPELTLAVVQRTQGREDRAVALVEDVLRREPDNLMAWGVLIVLSRGNDPDAVRRALAARRRLDPLNARPR